MDGASTDTEPEATARHDDDDEAPRGPPANAFTKLMAPKKKAAASAPPPSSTAAAPAPPKDRMGLGAYLADPASLPASVVIRHDAAFVAIRDRYPKATVHALLLPRDPACVLRHPFDALADPALLAAVRAQVDSLRVLVAAELRRRLGCHSASDAARQAVLDGSAAPESPSPSSGPPALPPGRDWAADVVCGVHAVPSMRHLHIHVLSRDMHSPALRHRKHYNSFATPFFVDVADFPLADDDPRRDPGAMGYLRRDLRCWRCGKTFGNQFKRFKEHLDVEFEAWKRI
ncbi:C2HE / C2H2 / C2HC zinc-binding finger domain-containing protein [Hirsutella rhossiliensis]|uniref:Aprataxin-like protein n=1 Tax=Hirsutella rhossiliensis TaxID=111463 RepID=A0A9P8SK90_9HYPO|nr:c2HE / c2H2 / c2HC zinc-binding finger domain-containing protein [Hirsutella rhossiliensis]KAH0964999.1 c2HE / c2H2 / c2HC zinc-binding finger domain-containing protein [Hirsutella rhossiliensis]